MRGESADRSRMQHAPAASIGYVLTHYPRVTQTFIRREIETLRAGGVEVYPMALNPPQGVDAVDPEAATTLVLKQAGVVGVLRALISAMRRSPIGVVRTLAGAAATSGGIGRRTITRVGHVAEALVVWNHARRNRIAHLHAHFGQTPSTIAMFASELGRVTGAGPTTYSFSVHCASEMHDTEWTLVDAKVRSAETVVCVSDHTRSHLMWCTEPDDWHRLEVVRCGVDLDRFAPRDERPLGDPPEVAIVGRLAPAKGHLVLLDAVARLAKDDVAIAVKIIGGGELEPEIRTRIQDLGLGERVTLVGEVAPGDVAGLLADADVLCLPSFDEGLPISIMEAMAVGVPVVSTYIAGIPELAVDGETAMVVPAGNADALADALERVVTDDELRARIVAGGRAAVEQLHDENDTLPAFLHAIGYAERIPS